MTRTYFIFYDAIEHFRGGEKNVVKNVGVVYRSHVLGTQKVHLLNSKTALKISSVTKDKTFYEKHLRQLIDCTSLRAIQWINFNHARN